MNKLSLKDDDIHANIVNKVKGQAPNADLVNKLSLKDQDGVHENIVHNVNQVNVKDVPSSQEDDHLYTEEAIDYFLKLAKEEVNVQDVPSLASMEQMNRSSQVIIFFKGHSMVTFHILNFLTFSTFSHNLSLMVLVPLLYLQYLHEHHHHSMIICSQNLHLKVLLLFH